MTANHARYSLTDRALGIAAFMVENEWVAKPRWFHLVLAATSASPLVIAYLDPGPFRLGFFITTVPLAIAAVVARRREKRASST